MSGKKTERKDETGKKVEQEHDSASAAIGKA